MRNRLTSVTILFVISLASAGISAFEYMPLQDIQPGMKCYAYSSFSPNTLEKMDVEIIGVIEGLTRDNDFILARVSSPEVQRGGISSGMSGSPVYYEDRLVGAMSMAFMYATEPICGITPIEIMNQLEDFVVASGRCSAQRRPRRDLLKKTEDPLSPGLKPIGLSLGINGISSFNDTFPDTFFLPSNASTHSFQKQADKKNDSDKPEIVPGCSVGVGLVSGDVSIIAYGTVTDVREKQILAFGHSMFGLGECCLPLHASEVVSIVPTRYLSFKLANSGPVIGAVTFDAESGILAELDKIPPVIPVSITIEGLTLHPVTYKIDVVDSEYLTTTMIVQSLTGLINNLGGLQGDLSLDFDLTAELSNGLSLHLTDCYGAVSLLRQAINNSMKTIETIHHNPLEPVTFKSIGIMCRLAETTRLATLDAVTMVERCYRPGETIRVQLLFHGDRIEPFSRIINVPIPPTCAPGKYVLKILDADLYARDVSARQLPAHRYGSFEKWFDTLSDRISGNQLQVMLAAGGKDIQTQDTILPSAPPVLRGLLAMPGLDHRVLGSTRVLSSETLSLDVQVVGGKQLPIYIDILPEKNR